MEGDRLQDHWGEYFKTIRNLGTGSQGVVNLVKRRSDDKLFVLKESQLTIQTNQKDIE